MTEAVIVSTARSPIGRAGKGSLRTLRPDDLLSQIVGAVLAKTPELDPHEIEDVIVGCAQPSGEQGHNLARVVTVLNGLDDVPGTTVNRFCASSLQAVRMAVHTIKAGEGDAFLAAGVESVSRYADGVSDWTSRAENPCFDRTHERNAELMAGRGTWTDPRSLGQVPDIYLAMGQTAENVAQIAGVTRLAQDEWALTSQARAAAAIESGSWGRDITAITLPDGSTVTADDCPRSGTTLDGLAGLKPIFRPEGTVTAGNACPLNDGAAAVVMMSDARAKQLGLVPLARVVSTAVSGLSPKVMGLGPVDASRSALARAGLDLADIDLVELNEAFAAQVIPSARTLGIPEDKLNVHGGAIALGHPFGMTGARSRRSSSTLCRRPMATSAWRPCASGAARAWPWSSNASPDVSAADHRLRVVGSAVQDLAIPPSSLPRPKAQASAPRSPSPCQLSSRRACS